MIQLVLRVVSVPVAIVVLTAASCSMAMPTQPGAVSSAPVITHPACGAVSTWPDKPLRLAWLAADTASTYTIEIDCLDCGDYKDPWVSQSGKPWLVRHGLESPFYAIDVISTVRREGGRAMRWRVWTVDPAGREIAQTDWCVTVFSSNGLPTPGANVP